MTIKVVVSILSPVCLERAALHHRVHWTLLTNDGDPAPRGQDHANSTV
jgi:hypothetical protein